VPILTAATDLQGFTWLLSYGQQGGQLPAAAGKEEGNGRRGGFVFLSYYLDCYLVPGTTRPRRLLTLWLLPEHQRVIGFSFQLAIIQHQFALHALGYCHLCKDGESLSRAQPYFGVLGVTLIGRDQQVHARRWTSCVVKYIYIYIRAL